MRSEYGDVYRLRLLNTNCYVLAHPEHIEYVLRKGHENFRKDRFTRSSLSAWVKGCSRAKGGMAPQRRATQPAFESGRVAAYAGMIVESALRMAARWEDGQSRNVYHDLTRLTLEIAAETLFGADIGDQSAEVSGAMEELAHYMEHPLHWTGMGQLLPTPATFRFRRAVRRLDAVINRMIDDRNRNGTNAPDFLSALLASTGPQGEPLTRRQLLDQALTVLAAGHETTAIVLAFCLHLLAMHPPIAEKLTDEFDRILDDRPPTAEDLPFLRYAECVVKETMRLFPPAYQIGREATVDCEVGNYFVPKRTVVLPTQWIVHRDPRWFEQPEAFIPERWEGEFHARLPRCAYFPFGDGPRICVGSNFAMTESVLVLATLISKFRVAPISTAPPRLLPSVTLRPRDGISVMIQKRPKTKQGRPVLQNA